MAIRAPDGANKLRNIRLTPALLIVNDTCLIYDDPCQSSLLLQLATSGQAFIVYLHIDVYICL